MISNEKFILNNNIEIPKLGLGTWLTDDNEVSDVVRNAIKVGYRHIDTAEAYGNERGVGEGIRTSGINRSDIFVTTKLFAEIKNYDDAKKAIQKSLDDLDIGYIDMMLIHAPEPWAEFREGKHYFEGNLKAWKALEEYYADGKIKVIGVSNFEKEDLDNILANAKTKPAVNQILCHISNTPMSVIDYCKKNEILVEAYSPIAHGEILQNKTVLSIAEKYGVSSAQLSIRYCLQLGLLPLPKTTNIEHMKSNMNVDFSISADDMEKLMQIEKIKNYGNASGFPVFGGKLTAGNVFVPRDFVHKK